MCVKLATQTAMHHTRAGPCLRVIAVENAHGNRVTVAPEVDGETSHRYSGVIHITYAQHSDQLTIISNNDTCGNLCGVTLVYAATHTGKTTHPCNAYTHMRMTVRERWEAPNCGREYRELRVRVRCRQELAGFVPLVTGDFSSVFTPELVNDTLTTVEKSAVVSGNNRSVSSGGHSC